MLFDEVVSKRVSVRNFLDKEVTIDEIKQIIEAGRLAPSSKNRQPYLYVLVNSQQKQAIVNQMRTIQPSEEPTILASAKIIEQASKFVLVFCNYSNNNPKGDLLSIGASIENCCLKATDLKIDSLWCRDIVSIKNFIYEYLNIDSNKYTLESGICFGYRAKQPYKKQKKKLEEILVINE